MAIIKITTNITGWSQVRTVRTSALCLFIAAYMNVHVCALVYIKMLMYIGKFSHQTYFT